MRVHNHPVCMRSLSLTWDTFKPSTVSSLPKFPHLVRSTRLWNHYVIKQEMRFESGVFPSCCRQSGEVLTFTRLEKWRRVLGSSQSPTVCPSGRWTGTLERLSHTFLRRHPFLWYTSNTVRRSPLIVPSKNFKTSFQCERRRFVCGKRLSRVRYEW